MKNIWQSLASIFLIPVLLNFICSLALAGSKNSKQLLYSSLKGMPAASAIGALENIDLLSQFKSETPGLIFTVFLKETATVGEVNLKLKTLNAKIIFSDKKMSNMMIFVPTTSLHVSADEKALVQSAEKAINQNGPFHDAHFEGKAQDSSCEKAQQLVKDQSLLILKERNSCKLDSECTLIGGNICGGGSPISKSVLSSPAGKRLSELINEARQICPRPQGCPEFVDMRKLSCVASKCVFQ